MFVTFYTFNYLLSREDEDAFLGNVFSTLTEGGLFVADLFYPQTALVDEAGHWRERVLSQGGREVKVLDRRVMEEKIERREMRFIEGDSCDVVTTFRRFIDKQEMASLLELAGFEGIEFMEGYDSGTLHGLRSGEAADGTFVAMARRQPLQTPDRDAAQSKGAPEASRVIAGPAAPSRKGVSGRHREQRRGA